MENETLAEFTNDMITYSKADIRQTVKIFEDLKNSPKITDEQVRHGFASDNVHVGDPCPWALNVFDKWLEDRDEHIRKQAREDSFEEAARILLLDGVGVMMP